MNDKEKLDFIKKEITGLSYLNSILTDAISYHYEPEELPKFLYLNSVMENKFESILKIL